VFHFLNDIRIAIRAMARTPGFTALSVITVGLGIGATTAVFSMVQGVLLRRLPYADGDRLVRLVQPSANSPDVGFSVTEVQDYRQVPQFAAVAEYHSMAFQLYGRGEPQRVQTGVVSDDFFTLLGVRPLHGRLFLPGEEAIGAPPVVVLSYRYWMDDLGGDSTVIGSTFTMNDKVHTIVGILPPLPTYPDDNDIWMPAGACPFRSSPRMMTQRDMRMVSAFAVLRPGVTMTEAQNSLAATAARLRTAFPAAYPAASKLTVHTVSLHDELTNRSRALFLTLLATAVFVLLVATANFANLMLARQARRLHEMALRSALGAGRGQLFRQLVTESLCVTLAGGALGVLIAANGLDLLRNFAARVTPRADEISLDPVVLGFALLVSVLVGIGAALAPFLRTAPSLNDALRAGSVTTTGGKGDRRRRDALVAAQVAVAFVLLVGAGLLTRSLDRLERVDGGYQPSGVLTARVDLNWTRYTSRALDGDFADRLVQRLSGPAGIVSVAVASDFPLNNAQPASQPFEIQGRTTPVGQRPPHSDATTVSPNYFTALGIPVLKGRAFTNADRDTANIPVIISHRLATTYWAGSDPLGARLSFDGGLHWGTIVGVVGDVRQNDLSQDISDEVYVPFADRPNGDFRVLLRATGDPMAFAPRLRAVVHELDAQQPVVDVRTLEQLRGVRLAEPRVTTVLIAAFAVLAVIITAGGLAGVISYGVSQRVPEIGIRVALGAEGGRVLWLVVREGAATVAIGLVLGLAGALAGTRAMRGLLYGVAPTDGATFIGVALLLLAIAGVACLVPARRAMRVDPVDALRSR